MSVYPNDVNSLHQYMYTLDTHTTDTGYRRYLLPHHCNHISQLIPHTTATPHHCYPIDQRLPSPLLSHLPSAPPTTATPSPSCYVHYCYPIAHLLLPLLLPNLPSATPPLLPYLPSATPRLLPYLPSVTPLLLPPLPAATPLLLPHPPTTTPNHCYPISQLLPPHQTLKRIHLLYTRAHKNASLMCFLLIYI
ncbi:hypothetical protein DPMN_024551 [Dreissena polymorpha]|uniref:Uncharacterized protein n=1 Tax=Dreissena polymorpha TaxID=45954 RepID=A0A9D4LPZ8_DREPO|nr:hypothetical protein DPMN_024551 [Dreissena polymorpha]